MSTEHDDCAKVLDLLGAYALDAVEAHEAALVSAHLVSCPRCASEVSEHRETIGLLAASGSGAPADVWERISQHLGTPAVQKPRPAPLPFSRPQPRWQRPMIAFIAAVAAAAAVLAGVQTNRVDRLDRQVHQLSSAAREPGIIQAAIAAMANSSAQHGVLVSTSIGANSLGELVILPTGSAYLVGSSLPALPKDKTYQAWILVSGRPVSVGVLGTHPTTAALSIEPGDMPRVFLLTVEPEGGVIAPTSAPIAKAST